MGIVIYCENTQHKETPSGTLYTFFKLQPLEITKPEDVDYFKKKIERGSGFHYHEKGTGMVPEALKDEFLDSEKLGSKHISELRRIAAKKGLDVSGSKQEILKRILDELGIVPKPIVIEGEEPKSKKEIKEALEEEGDKIKAAIKALGENE